MASSPELHGLRQRVAALAAAVPQPPTAAGAVVMAFGIFGAAALPRLAGAAAALTTPLAAGIAVAWAMIAAAILLSALRQGIAAHTGSAISSFAIGTWVAGSAVTARMLMLGAPGALWLAKAAFWAGVGVWLWFVPLALRNLARLVAAHDRRASGVVLLSTVATQAVALIGLRLYPTLPQGRWLAAVCLVLGAVCYLAGLVLIARRYIAPAAWSLAFDWDNSNCIIHGALSITGLTATAGGFLSERATMILWLWTLAVFALIESVEIARALARGRRLGWRRAILVYDLSQWARNFTFGMFYAFTAAFAARFDLAGFPVIGQLRAAILAWGQYLVLVLLLIEAALMLAAHGRAVMRRCRPVSTAPRAAPRQSARRW